LNRDVSGCFTVSAISMLLKLFVVVVIQFKKVAEKVAEKITRSGRNRKRSSKKEEEEEQARRAAEEARRAAEEEEAEEAEEEEAEEDGQDSEEEGRAKKSPIIYQRRKKLPRTAGRASVSVDPRRPSVSVEPRRSTSVFERGGSSDQNLPMEYYPLQQFGGGDEWQQQPDLSGFSQNPRDVEMEDPEGFQQYQQQASYDPWSQPPRAHQFERRDQVHIYLL